MIEKIYARQYQRAVFFVALFFAAIAAIGAIHSLLRGYSGIYTAIFIMLAAGFLLLAYLINQIVLLVPNADDKL